jgi:hypothetical protein
MNKGKAPAIDEIRPIQSSKAVAKEEKDPENKEKQSHQEVVAGKRGRYNGKSYTGMLKFIGVKGKVIDIPSPFAWISPPDVPLESTSSSVSPAVQSPKKTFEDKQCYDALVPLAKELCGKGENVQGIIICQRNQSTVFGSEKTCLSNILHYQPPHVTIIMCDGVLRKCTFQFGMLLPW